MAEACRQGCRYGAACRRKNPNHRATLSHPGDDDWSEDAGGEAEGEGAASSSAASSYRGPRFASIRLPEGKQQLYGDDSNKLITAARASQQNCTLPELAMSGGALRLELRFAAFCDGGDCRGYSMVQVNLDTDNAREVIELPAVDDVPGTTQETAAVGSTEAAPAAAPATPATAAADAGPDHDDADADESAPPAPNRRPTAGGAPARAGAAPPLKKMRAASPPAVSPFAPAPAAAAAPAIPTAAAAASPGRSGFGGASGANAFGGNSSFGGDFGGGGFGGGGLGDGDGFGGADLATGSPTTDLSGNRASVQLSIDDRKTFLASSKLSFVKLMAMAEAEVAASGAAESDSGMPAGLPRLYQEAYCELQHKCRIFPNVLDYPGIENADRVENRPGK